MNKNKFKILLFLTLMIIGISNVNAKSLDVYTNPETYYEVIVEDDAELLNDTELYTLQEEMKELTQYGNIAFKTILDNEYNSVERYASSYYRSIFGTTSGTVFLIDMDTRYIYIYSDGENYTKITNDKATIITDNVYKYAQRAEYYECASVAFSQINTILSGGKIAEPMKYISNTLIALTLAFFLSFIYILINTSKNKATAKEIVSGCLVEFNIGDVTSRKIGQHREYSPRSSSSGGGSSGGGGGGGSSGGGGGHGF